MSQRILASLRLTCGWLALALLLFAAPVGANWKIQPIQIAPGASSATIQGAVVRGERVLYSIVSRQGQLLSLRISALEKNATFQLYAPGAKPETRDSILQVAGETLSGAGEEDDAAQWSGKLPRSGRYLLVVGSTRGNATYKLTIKIH